MTLDDQIREIYEMIDPEHKLPPDAVEELAIAIDDLRLNPPVNGQPLPGHPGVYYGVLESELKEKMAVETDWRKKASLAARIISLGLE